MGIGRSEGLAARGYFIPEGASQRGGGQAPAFRVARCQTWTGVRPKIGRKLTKIHQKRSKSTKVNMLKFGDVSFDLGFERGRMSATGYVAKISMLRLNIGSTLTQLMHAQHWPFKARGGAAPLALFAFGSEANAEHA